ncbi:PhzF family phenazine biosynthesis protein, partial [candidate division KSB1 bacterium]|nr:PhzF family phenazine biosynthesis protein [candidate division KSB1 bacterium]NIS22771.1 PhzF family phenazine biosynthesis protein [candidate division KSB1 bacterium]NIT69611.1 PhzF family phenazine biosynthesis protein [candidate division KSB1 bacterium]NIU23280.1 PhzF family phenazine biosynthesis protein [candidate division KSB1 bacterium]NIU91658.1 hypothetical protein [candidate division KSB1 bacterium]
RPDFETLWSVCDRYETTGFYPFCLRAEQPFEVEARQFPTHAGYNENAATGVAACALGVYLTQHAVFGAREDGWHTYRVRQGYAMGAPSLMIVESFLEKGRVSQTRVQGKATIHAEELIEINSLF